MDSLVLQLLHKVSGEWNRKGREFNLAIAKASTNSLTKDSAVERALRGVVDEATKLLKNMEAIEERYATGKDVSSAKQRLIKASSVKIYDLIKSGNKLKFSMWGYCTQKL